MTFFSSPDLKDMSGLETITSSVQDVLIDSLQFTPKPGASYITARRDTRFFAAGSDSYQPDTGVKVIRINLTGAPQEWLDPASLRISFDLTNRSSTAVVQPITGPWAFFSRVSIRVLGTLVEDLQQYGLTYQVFSNGLTEEARQREMDMSFGGIIDSNQREQPEHIPQSETRTVTMNLLSGLFSGQNKHLWLSAMGPVTIELELADASVPCKLGEHSPAVAATATTGAVAAVQRTNEWKISNVFAMGSIVDLSPDLINAYTGHLESGKSLPYSFGTYATVQHAIQRPADFSVNQSRAFSRLNTIFAVFSQPRDLETSEVSYFSGKCGDAIDEHTMRQASDNLETYISLGGTRYPQYPTQKLAHHRLYYVSALGKLNSDVHTPGTKMQAWRHDKMVLGWDMEKAHSGSGAAFSGTSTRNGDLLTLFCKNGPADANKLTLINHFEVIARISAAGCDLLD